MRYLTKIRHVLSELDPRTPNLILAGIVTFGTKLPELVGGMMGHWLLISGIFFLGVFMFYYLALQGCCRLYDLLRDVLDYAIERAIPARVKGWIVSHVSRRMRLGAGRDSNGACRNVVETTSISE